MNWGDIAAAAREFGWKDRARRGLETIWFEAKTVGLPDQFKLRASRTFSFAADDYVFAVHIVHEGETAERSGLQLHEVRAAVLACRDEIMARAIAHLT